MNDSIPEIPAAVSPEAAPATPAAKRAPRKKPAPAVDAAMPEPVSPLQPKAQAPTIRETQQHTIQQSRI